MSDRTWLRVLGAILVPALPAAVAMHRHFGVDGLLAVGAAAMLAVLVMALPTVWIPRGRLGDGPNRVLALTVVRMGLFLAAAVSVMFAADDAMRAPAALLFGGFYLLSLAVETVAEVWAAPGRNPGRAEETR